MGERAAGRASGAGGSGGEPERGGVCTPGHPGRSTQAWLSALVETQKKLPACHGKVCGLWKCAVSADDDGGDDDAEPPYHCHDDGPSRSSVAETVSRCCHGGGERAVQTAVTFPV